jgi:hypothetical protein
VVTIPDGMVKGERIFSPARFVSESLSIKISNASFIEKSFSAGAQYCGKAFHKASSNFCSVITLPH